MEAGTTLSDEEVDELFAALRRLLSQGLGTKTDQDRLFTAMTEWETATSDLMQRIHDQLRQATATKKATRSYAPLRAFRTDQHLSRKV